MSGPQDIESATHLESTAAQARIELRKKKIAEAEAKKNAEAKKQEELKASQEARRTAAIEAKVAERKANSATLLRMVYHRRVKGKRDIVINARCIKINLVRNVEEKQLKKDGRVILVWPAGFNAGDAGDDIAKLPETRQRELLENNSIDLVAYTPNLTSGKLVFGQMSRIGTALHQYATKVIIKIVCATPRSGTRSPQRSAYRDTKGNWKNDPDHTVTARSPEFVFMQELVQELNNFASLSSLDVVICNGEYTRNVPYTNEQLYLAIPFYGLAFKDRTLTHQGPKMIEVRDMDDLSLSILESEATACQEKQLAAEALRSIGEPTAHWPSLGQS
jgi:hypothetical protein